MKRILLLSALFFLAGCPSSGIAPNKAINVPVDRLYKYQAVTPETTAKLTLIRDGGAVGMACKISVLLNGERVASFKPKEKATFNLKSGEWIVALQADCLGGNSPENVPDGREINLKDDSHKTYRITTDTDGLMDIKPIHTL